MYRFDTEEVAALALPPEAVICVPTFQRPHMLQRTLASLAAQVTGIPFAVVVVDNDSVGQEGASVAARYFREGRLRGLVAIEPAQGNCHAINRAFATALAHYEAARDVLMIDDDEIADPRWLAAMVSTAREQRCDIVGGPVLPIFESAHPPLAGHPVFRPAYSTSGRVAMIYGSGNCLITRAAFERLGSSCFDPSFNFLGGGDTEFFTRAKAAGLRFFWTQNAIVHESVGAERLTARWIVKRGLRIGAINYRIERLRAGTLGARAKVMVKNAGVAAFAGFRSLKLLLAGAPALETLHPLIIALGRCLAAIGLYPEQYRAKSHGSPQ
ncbi:MAG: glycosyltransferase [Beijerinckiaceae bacterium]